MINDSLTKTNVMYPRVITDDLHLYRGGTGESRYMLFVTAVTHSNPAMLACKKEFYYGVTPLLGRWWGGYGTHAIYKCTPAAVSRGIRIITSPSVGVWTYSMDCNWPFVTRPGHYGEKVETTDPSSSPPLGPAVNTGELGLLQPAPNLEELFSLIIRNQCIQSVKCHC
jgi:hypothetical protein